MFTGFPEAALDFYDDLEADNSRTFWNANTDVYESCVREPMKEVAAALEEEFGTAKLYRPHRDVRFSKDKTPYKTYQDLFVSTGPALGWYLRLSAPGLMVGAGFYAASSQSLRLLRELIAGPRGAELDALLAPLIAADFELGGDTVATVPRGYPKDHQRISLLRHKSLHVSHSYGFDPIIHTQQLLDAVRSDWGRCRPLVEWFGEIL